MISRKKLAAVLSVGLLFGLSTSTLAYEGANEAVGSTSNMSVWLQASELGSSSYPKMAQSCRTAGQDCADQSECCSDLICERISNDSDPDGEIQVCVRP